MVLLMLYLMVLILLLPRSEAMTTLAEERNRAFAERFALHLDDVRFQRDSFLYGFGSRKTAGAVAASGFRLRGVLARAAARLVSFLGKPARLA